MSDLTIFLDDGGVMNDNNVRAPQWQELVGEYLSPRLGGDPQSWSAANKVAAPGAWEAFSRVVEHEPESEFAPLGREMDRAWLASMCEIVGIATPPAEECVALTRETASFVTRRVRSAYPGAIDAIRELQAQGYSLGTASGEMSPELDGYLEGMGVRELFTMPLFGPDLVNLPKNSPRYYERIFDNANVNPRNAIVVDDAPHVLDWAESLGARTVLVTTRGAHNGAHQAIDSLAELPALLSERAT
jgi:phosphoglycolate phosphatase-like HAD superfamily hydrolase